MSLSARWITPPPSSAFTIIIIVVVVVIVTNNASTAWMRSCYPIISPAIEKQAVESKTKKSPCSVLVLEHTQDPPTKDLVPTSRIVILTHGIIFFKSQIIFSWYRPWYFQIVVLGFFGILDIWASVSIRHKMLDILGLFEICWVLVWKCQSRLDLSKLLRWWWWIRHSLWHKRFQVVLSSVNYCFLDKYICLNFRMYCAFFCLIRVAIVMMFVSL